MTIARCVLVFTCYKTAGRLFYDMYYYILWCMGSSSRIHYSGTCFNKKKMFLYLISLCEKNRACLAFMYRRTGEEKEHISRTQRDHIVV